MSRRRVLYEIRFRSTKPGKNGGQGAERTFLAELRKGTHKEAQQVCHDGLVISVRKATVKGEV